MARSEIQVSRFGSWAACDVVCGGRVGRAGFWRCCWGGLVNGAVGGSIWCLIEHGDCTEEPDASQPAREPVEQTVSETPKLSAGGRNSSAHVLWAALTTAKL